MTNTTTIADIQIAAAADTWASSVLEIFRFRSGTLDLLRDGFIAGADWYKEWQEDHEAFNGRLGPADDDTAHMAKVLESREPYAPPSDDAWRATLQATINQQAEEIKQLRRTLTECNSARDLFENKLADRERRLIDMTKIATGAA